MPRAYIRAGTRLRQLERLIRVQFELTGAGITPYELVPLSGLAYQSVCAYVQRLVRERRVDVELIDVALGGKSQQRLYPLGAAPKTLAKAA